jgi:hypothetical protein
MFRRLEVIADGKITRNSLRVRFALALGEKDHLIECPAVRDDIRLIGLW